MTRETVRRPLHINQLQQSVMKFLNDPHLFTGVAQQNFHLGVTFQGIYRTDDAIHVRRVPAAAPTAPPVTPYSVMVELVEDDELVRRLKRAQRRRSR